MSLDNINDYSNTAGSNTDIGGNNIAENNLPGTLNNALRELTAQLVRELADKGSDITAAGTTNIAATGTSGYAGIVGVTTIISFGTPNGEPMRWVHWKAATPVTHNATSMILRNGASRTNVVGDVSLFVHEGSGNWRELYYSGTPSSLSITASAAGTFITLTSTDAGAGVGPDIDLFRDSASPAIADFTGSLLFSARDSAGNKTQYASITSLLGAVLDGAESGRLRFTTLQAGVSALRFSLDAGLYASGLTDKGAGAVNASGLYVGGHGTVAQEIIVTSAAIDSTASNIPNDTSKPLITEGKGVFSQAVTPINASSIITVEVELQLSHASTGTDLVASVFDSAISATDAVAVGPVAAAGTHMTPAVVKYSFTAGSLSARTISVRYGGNTGTTFLNQGSATAFYGGTITSSMKITEVLPQ
jgi:hypothetical protein